MISNKPICNNSKGDVSTATFLCEVSPFCRIMCPVLDQPDLAILHSCTSVKSTIHPNPKLNAISWLSADCIADIDLPKDSNKYVLVQTYQLKKIAKSSERQGLLLHDHDVSCEIKNLFPRKSRMFCHISQIYQTSFR